MKFAYLIEPPFNYQTVQGHVTGCDVELARYVACQLGTPFTPVETEFAALLPGLAADRWEMTTGLFATAERRANTAFSKPVWALPDGLLVAQGNPKHLTGYRSIAADETCQLAVIRDQFQHRSAIEFGVPNKRIHIFDTYQAAAHAVQAGQVDAYASVARAHLGFLEQSQNSALESVMVPGTEKQPTAGAFGIALHNNDLHRAVDAVLADYIGSAAHRTMMRSFGFTDAEVDLIAP